MMISAGSTALRPGGRTVLIGAFAALMMLSCINDKSVITSPPPVLSVTPFDLAGPYDAMNGVYGDIKFSPPVIVPFGTSLGGTLLSPAIQYYTVPNAPVRAVTAGIVDSIVAYTDGSGDYQVRVVCTPGTDYEVIYDHVLDVAVLQASAVAAGDTIGRAGTWNGQMRRTALQVNAGQGNNTRAYCPLNYGDTSFVNQHRRLLDAYNSIVITPHLDTLCISGPVLP
jgi:hypothetical protein